MSVQKANVDKYWEIVLGSIWKLERPIHQEGELIPVTQMWFIF
jgi:hypothetical protein